MKPRVFLILITILSGLAFTIGTTPEVNQKIVEYTKSKMGKKIDRGECWDLVSEALNASNADWKAPEGFGKLLDPKKEAILPGDVIQFKNVTIESKNSIATFVQHYGLVYSVADKNKISMAHQNFNNDKRVQLYDFSLEGVKKGKITFYRPQSK